MVTTVSFEELGLRIRVFRAKGVVYLEELSRGIPKILGALTREEDGHLEYMSFVERLPRCPLPCFYVACTMI